LADLTNRAASLLRFLEHHADKEGLVRADSGVEYNAIPQKWADFESANNPVPLGGRAEATADDFEDVLSELVMKQRVLVGGDDEADQRNEMMLTQPMFAVVIKILR